MNDVLPAGLQTVVRQNFCGRELDGRLPWESVRATPERAALDVVKSPDPRAPALEAAAAETPPMTREAVLKHAAAGRLTQLEDTCPIR